MHFRYCFLFWMCLVATFRNVFSDTSTLTNDPKAFIDVTSRIKIAPRGERRLRLKKKPTSTSSKSDISSNGLSTKNDISSDDFRFDRSPNFLQVIPFRLSDGTPMLRWRPGQWHFQPKVFQKKKFDSKLK